MAGYFVKSVKCGVGNGGMACGPVAGPVIAELNVLDYSDEEFYLCLAEVDGIPNFFKTDRSTIEEQLGKDLDDGLVEYLNNHYIGHMDYEEIFENDYSEWNQLLRFLIYIVRADWDVFNQYKDAVIDEDIEDIEVPMSDLEEEYMDEYDDDEEDDYDEDDEEYKEDDEEED